MVKVPNDRITHQPARGFCRNPQCRDQSDQEFHFDVKNDHFACPKCGADREPMAGLLSLVHLLIRNPDGPIIGAGGLRYAIGCDLKRAYLATITNQEAATDNIEIANCPGCLERARSLGLTVDTWQFTPLQASEPDDIEEVEV